MAEGPAGMTVGSDYDFPDLSTPRKRIMPAYRPEIPLDIDPVRALSDAVQRRGRALIASLREMDGSKDGAAFNSPWLGRARDAIETAIAVTADEAARARA